MAVLAVLAVLAALAGTFGVCVFGLGRRMPARMRTSGALVLVCAWAGELGVGCVVAVTRGGVAAWPKEVAMVACDVYVLDVRS